MTHRSSQLGSGRRGTPGSWTGGLGAGPEDRDEGKVLSLEEIKTPSSLGAAAGGRRSRLENTGNHHLTAQVPINGEQMHNTWHRGSYSATKWSEAPTLAQRGWTLGDAQGEQPDTKATECVIPFMRNVQKRQMQRQEMDSWVPGLGIPFGVTECFGIR